MKRVRNTTKAVTLRTKGIENRPEKGCLEDEPEFRALSRMIDSGDVSKRRTLGYLKGCEHHEAEEKRQERAG